MATSDDRLDKWEAATKAATAAPWKHDDGIFGKVLHEWFVVAQVKKAVDWEFIALSRTEAEWAQRCLRAANEMRDEFESRGNCCHENFHSKGHGADCPVAAYNAAYDAVRGEK